MEITSTSFAHENDELFKMTRTDNIELMKLYIQDKKINLINSLIPLSKNIEEISNLLDKMFNLKITDTDNNHHINPITVEPEPKKEESHLIHEEEKEPQLKQEEPVQTAIHVQGPVVQLYRKDDLTNVVAVFNSITEAIRDFKNYQHDNSETPTLTSIKKAHQHKILYLNHRWNLISRDELHPETSKDIGETVHTNERQNGQVAMLNLDKTKIIKIYPLSKDAAADILQHASALCSAIKYGTVLHNHYWAHLKNLPDELKEEYEKQNTIPKKTPNIRGVKINVFNIKTNTLIKVFNSYTEINNELNISTQTIKKYIKLNEPYNGTYKFTLI